MSGADAPLRADLAEIADLAARIAILAAGRAPDLQGEAERLAGLASAARARLDAGAVAKPAKKLPKFDHVGIAVHDLEKAAPLFFDILGAELVGGGTNDRAGLRTLILDYPGGGKIEVLQSVGDTPLSRFIAKRGEGVHHLTFLVADLRASIARCRDAGYVIVDEDYSEPGWLEAYVSPRSGHGCLVQLVEAAADYGKAVEGVTVADVLADRWEWIDQKARRRAGSTGEEPGE